MQYKPAFLCHGKLLRIFHGIIYKMHTYTKEFPMNIRKAKPDCLFLTESGGEIVGVFAFLLGEEPTYRTIEGKWQNDLPYVVIHRIAGNGRQKGILEQCLNFCDTFTHNLRIDTHRQNAIMRHLLQKNGFLECGIIMWKTKRSGLPFSAVPMTPKPAGNTEKIFHNVKSSFFRYRYNKQKL